MSRIVSKPDYGGDLVFDNKATERFQEFLDDVEEKLNDTLLGDQVCLPTYSVFSLPQHSRKGGLIFVIDDSGGAVPAFSDGNNWRRVTDRKVVS